MLVADHYRRRGSVIRPDTDLKWGDQREWERENSIARTQGRSGGDSGGDTLESKMGLFRCSGGSSLSFL